MSYDLYIYPRQPFAAEDFARHFSGRANYTLGGDGSEAMYQNEDTGTYFTFTLSPPATPEEIAAEIEDEPERTGDADRMSRKSAPYIYFHMNYMRPHVFGIEAEPEVATFINGFDCAIDDGQINGMSDGRYTREGFLSGWNTGNRFGYKVILSNAESGVTRETLPEAVAGANLLAAPAQTIAAVWAWNFSRQRLQVTLEQLGHNVFAPRIMWALTRSSPEPVPFVIWRADIPTLLPAEASHLLIGLEPDVTGVAQKIKQRFLPSASQRQLFLVQRDALLAGVASQTIRAEGRNLVYCPTGIQPLDDRSLAALADAGPSADPNDLISVAHADAVLDIELFEDQLA